jgi:acyl CoA:acetate/3-ketoacid CoA transferase beta subunit
VLCAKVDTVTGVGYDRAAKLKGRTKQFHEIRRVVTNLCVLDFETPDNRMRVRSLHPGVTAEQVQEATGFELVIPNDVPESRTPTDDELRLLDEVIDPKGLRFKEVADD